MKLSDLLEDVKDLTFRLPRRVVTKDALEGLSKIDKLSFLKMELFALAFAEEGRDMNGFHPSEISYEDTLCYRKLYYDLAGLKADVTYRKDIDDRLQRIFDLGTMVHLYIQTSLYEQGVLEEAEVSIYSKRYNIVGHADGIVKQKDGFFPDLLKGERAMLEIKTINSYGFNGNKYRAGLTEPKVEHIKQASIYANFLGLDKIVFIYYNKDNSEIKTFTVGVDGKYLDSTLPKLRELVVLNSRNKLRKGKDISNHVLPVRQCRNVKSKLAQQCPYVKSCFTHK